MGFFTNGSRNMNFDHMKVAPLDVKVEEEMDDM
jgi:hypothetical protein